MWVRELRIDGFRNISEAHLEFADGINLLRGNNGSGKSSLLEAIQTLSNGRSFRTNKKLPVINHNADSFSLYSEISNDIAHRIGLSKQRDGSTQRRLNGRNLDSHSEITHLFPLTGVTPESGDFLTEGAKQRQAYIDWTLFHVEQSFYRVWKEFRRVHQQRNTLLRSSGLHNQLKSWDESYVRLGEELTHFREQAVTRILPLVIDYFSHFLPADSVEIRFRRGWSVERSLSEALVSSYQADIKLGYTQSGPQRADIQIRINGSPAADELSRGQRKLLHICFKLAQLKDYIETSHHKPVFYIDDLTAELDSHNVAKVMRSLSELAIQSFVTTPCDAENGIDMTQISKMFHVEQGRITVA